MKHIFLLRANDKDAVQRLIEWYNLRSTTAQHVRKMLVEKHNRDPKALIGLSFEELHVMANNLEVEVPDFTLKLTPPAPSVPMPASEVDAKMPSRPRHTLVSKLFMRAGKKRR
ncbi:uncharacterized protein PHACADRAFT_265242 [Phanerochaete carnosa HHB-10118-sp]|uniref:Uncharacterized protein n=1 Tax=Phanerochaete carnosa (strain HHB-10118-sp) TaxID=650164 RepID=K5VSX5_PHACS|nr:uncharacterized protein PHACADRAFT_265242 [Phanerochaete carnosa HHB-10118-sp]EKM49679.1 hypothetical protein PHACADRAFT_265242 [Phanerochaete carnosa HHB-10118-sp]